MWDPDAAAVPWSMFSDRICSDCPAVRQPQNDVSVVYAVATRTSQGYVFPNYVSSRPDRFSDPQARFHGPDIEII
jgi:hypothetical protein